MKSESNEEAMAELYMDHPAFALGVIHSILEDSEQDRMTDCVTPDGAALRR